MLRRLLSLRKDELPEVTRAKLKLGIDFRIGRGPIRGLTVVKLLRDDSGIKVGDLIQAVDDVQVSSTYELLQVLARVASDAPLSITVLRGGNVFHKVLLLDAVSTPTTPTAPIAPSHVDPEQGVRSGVLDEDKEDNEVSERHASTASPQCPALSQDEHEPEAAEDIAGEAPAAAEEARRPVGRQLDGKTTTQHTTPPPSKQATVVSRPLPLQLQTATGPIKGVLVMKVFPAALATGFQVPDLITMVQGQPVTRKAEALNLWREAGEPMVSFTVLRDGKLLDLSVQRTASQRGNDTHQLPAQLRSGSPVSSPSSPEAAVSSSDLASPLRTNASRWDWNSARLPSATGASFVIGDARRMVLMRAAARQQAMLGMSLFTVTAPVRGVTIKRVVSGSIAEQAGLRAGDLIQSVNGQAAFDVIDFARLWLATEHTALGPFLHAALTLLRGQALLRKGITLPLRKQGKQDPVPRTPPWLAQDKVKGPDKTPTQKQACRRAEIAWLLSRSFTELHSAMEPGAISPRVELSSLGPLTMPPTDGVAAQIQASQLNEKDDRAGDGVAPQNSQPHDDAIALSDIETLQR